MDDYSFWVTSEILKYMLLIFKMIASTVPSWVWWMAVMAGVVGVLQWRVQRR